MIITINPTIQKPGISAVTVELKQITDSDYKKIQNYLKSTIETNDQVSNAIADSFLYAIQLSPQENPSDIWQHIIYRSFIEMSYSDQQWKRISGFALERAFATFYNPIFNKYGMRFRALPKKEAQKLFQSMNIKGNIKHDKIDCVIEKNQNGSFKLVAGVHVKSSLAERIQDDVPASLALMEEGYQSIVLTMDSKSYPPPHGDGINYGELGGRTWNTDNEKEATKTRIKRQYIEDDGQFSALFSYNSRTPASARETKSGKRIYTLTLSKKHQPDAFVKFVLSNIK